MPTVTQKVAPLCFHVRDALIALQISRATLYKLEKKGKIRLVRIAGRTVVPLSEINRLLGVGEAA